MFEQIPALVALKNLTDDISEAIPALVTIGTLYAACNFPNTMRSIGKLYQKLAFWFNNRHFFR